MSLNIKNPEVHDLAREAARRTGKSQTGVVAEALRLYLASLDLTGGEARRQRVDMILADVDGRLDDDARAALTSDDLYDAQGLPA